jgi:hypothetical protein
MVVHYCIGFECSANALRLALSCPVYFIHISCTILNITVAKYGMRQENPSQPFNIKKTLLIVMDVVQMQTSLWVKMETVHLRTFVVHLNELDRFECAPK